MKIAKVKYKTDGTIHCWYHCAGCGYSHSFSPSVHTWNEDRDNPTVSPSLLHSNPQGHHTCHSFIKDGKIQFLNDCWHQLKGQTIELPEFDIAQLDSDLVDIV